MQVSSLISFTAPRVNSFILSVRSSEHFRRADSAPRPRRASRRRLMTPTARPESRPDTPAPEIERGDFARGPAAAADPAARLVVVSYNIRYAVGSHLIGGSLLRRAGLGWPARRPRLVGANIKKAARILEGRSEER